jgi:hypothetical protein
MTKPRRNVNCPICGVKYSRRVLSGNNPCRPCWRLMGRLVALHKRRPEQLPRAARPVKCHAEQ